MILVDTGPLVALFDPKDGQHHRCAATLKKIREPIQTTVPVLTEAFHMLDPASIGSNKLREFIAGAGMSVWHFDRGTLLRAFELMEQYAAQPMDLADASIVVAAEAMGARQVFTVDRRDFRRYRVRRGHRHYPLDVIP